MSDKAKIVVVGAGFGGLQAGISLKKKLGKKSEISVIDKSDCCLYTPELYKYLIGESKKEDVTTDLKSKLGPKGINFYQEKFENLDSKNRQIKTDKQVHEYDYLILSIGSEVQTFNIKGVEKAARFKTIGHANEIKEKIDRLGVKDKVNIVGAGLIAVELAGHLDKMSGKSSPKISLIGNKLLPGLNEKTRNKVRKYLDKKDIDLIEGSQVKEIKEDKVIYEREDINEIRSNLTIMATGFKIPEVAKGLGLDYNESGIKVNSYFETSTEKVFAIGDCSYLIQEGNFEKKRAQVAEKESKLLAKNIHKKSKGKEMKPYEINEIPTVVEIPPTYIFDYKEFSMKNKLVNLMKKFIKLKHIIM